MRCLDDETVLGYLQRRLGTVRAGEVERHVDRCAACRQLIAALASTSLLRRTSTGAVPSAWASDFLPPGVAIGRYVVEARIGSGATGIVYRARDPELGRAVAIKRLRADLADLRERFIAEARTLARMSHPNVVPVYDVGMHDEHAFVAMELVDGVTLRRCVVDLRREQILELYRQAARGLLAAHETGIFHGDFKPDNVLVAHDGRVLVADFGLLGTPAYMAPEQIDGGPPSAAADQFAWCVSLFEALTDHRPFAGESMLSLRVSIRRGRISPAIHRLPRWLAAALRRGLAEDPQQRFAHMDALLAALERHRRVARWPFAAIAVTVVAFAVVPATRARTAASHDDATIDAVAVGSASLHAAEDALARSNIPEAREHVRAALTDADASGDEPTAAAALVVRGRIESLTDRADVGLRSLTDAYALASASGATGVTVDAAIEITRVLAIDGERIDEAREWQRHAEVALERHGTDVERSLALTTATALLDTLGNDLEAARSGFERALAGYEERPGTPVTTIAATKSNLGVVLGKLGRDDEALAVDKDALTMLERAGLESHHVYGRALLNIATLEWKVQRMEQSREHLERALAVFIDALGPDAILVGRAANNLGGAELQLENVEAAARAYDRAHDVLSRALGPEHPSLAIVLLGHANVSIRERREVEAREQLERAAGILERAHGLDHIGLVPILTTLGELARTLGDVPGSRRHTLKAIDVLERVHGPEYPGIATPLEDLVNTTMGMGDFDEAERLLARVHALRSKSAPADDPSLYRSTLLSAKLLIERGDYAGAHATLDRAASLAEGRAQVSAVELTRAETLWRAGDRRRAVALVRRAKQTLGDDPGQQSLAASMDDWLRERVGEVER